MIMVAGIAIVIVAAGSSSRMKNTKQLLPLGKTTLLGNAIVQAKASAAEEVITILGANLQKISSEIARFNINIIENKQWEKGIGSSIAAGMKYMLEKKNYKAAIIMLADQPLIDSEYLNQLIQIFEQNPFRIVATKYPKSNGVPALFPSQYFEQLSELTGDVGAKYLLNGETSVVTIDAGNKIVDIDTPYDYREIRKDFLNRNRE